MATEPEETRTFYGWFGCLSPETKEVRLNIVKDIIKELEEENVAVFAGAGLSMPAGYVSWGELLKPIAEELGIDIKKEYGSFRDFDNFIELQILFKFSRVPLIVPLRFKEIHVIFIFVF